MRILTICPGLGIGGTERSAVNFTLGYREAGHEVAFLNHGADGSRRSALEDAGVPVFTAGANPEGALAEAGRFDPEIIHIHRRGWRDDRETRLMEHLRASHRRILEQNVFGGADYSAGGRLVDVHLHLSGWCLWRWRRWLRAGGSRAVGVIIPDPVRAVDFRRATDAEIVAFREKLGIKRAAFVCGRVGQPIDGKWHPQMLWSFAELAAADREAHLVVMGMPAGLAGAVQSLPGGVRRRIVQLPVSEFDAELSTVYSALDCFLHIANQGESFGLVLVEAMLCGTPVVTVSQPHRDNSQAEVVGHRRGGLVAGSMGHVTQALLRMHDDVALRESIRAGAREAAASRFDVSVVVRKAIRVAEIALAASAPEELQARLRDGGELESAVDEARIDALIHDVEGSPSRWDLARMRLLHTPAVNWAKCSLRRVIRED